MNTNLKVFGEILNKKTMKQLKGGEPGVAGMEGIYGILCSVPEGIAPCKICHAHSTDGSNIDRSFANTNFAVMDSWESFWRTAGYRVECVIAAVS